MTCNNYNKIKFDAIRSFFFNSIKKKKIKKIHHISPPLLCKEFTLYKIQLWEENSHSRGQADALYDK